MNSRRNPFDVFDEMERAFEQMRRSMWGDHGHGAWTREGGRGYPGGPAYGYEYGEDSNLTVEATEDGYVVFADLPGFEKEEIDLRFEDGSLHVNATHDVSDGEYARSRRVRESVSIAGDVRVEEIEATYRNGVLEIHVPVEGMDDEEHGHRIDVE